MLTTTFVPAAVPAARASRWAEPALLGLVLFAALVGLGDRLLGDADTHWHIAIGGRIWADRAVPWTDSWSHTFAGAPWIAKEWLSQLLLHGAFAAAGWQGVVALTAATLALVFAILFAWLERRLRGTVAFSATLVAICLVAPHFLARPHVFGLLALLLWTIGLVSAVERGRSPPLWCLAVLVVWANLHGSFTIAYPLAAFIGAEAVLFAPAGQRAGSLSRWATFGLLALAAGLATPYGIHAALVTASLAEGGEALPFLTEWQPLGFDGLGIATLVSAALLAGSLAFGLPATLLRIAATLGLAALAMRHGRFLDVYALAAPLLAAGPLARRWPAIGPEEADGAASRKPAWFWVAVAAIGAGAACLSAVSRPVPSPAVTPSAALAAARQAGVAGPVYNDYDFGGFLIASGVPTFIDGRTDQLFLDGFVTSVFAAARAGTPDALLALLDRHGVGWALVSRDGFESRHLSRAAGWRRLYGDATAEVFVRAGTLPR